MLKSFYASPPRLYPFPLANYPYILRKCLLPFQRDCWIRIPLLWHFHYFFFCSAFYWDKEAVSTETALGLEDRGNRWDVLEVMGTRECTMSVSSCQSSPNSQAPILILIIDSSKWLLPLSFNDGSLCLSCTSPCSSFPGTRNGNWMMYQSSLPVSSRFFCTVSGIPCIAAMACLCDGAP